jgi:hypothetical protein
MDSRIPPLSYAPDGLHESDIDALIAEYFTTDNTDAMPCTVSDRVSANRHVRRLNRQIIGAALRVHSCESNCDDADGAAA